MRFFCGRVQKCARVKVVCSRAHNMWDVNTKRRCLRLCWWCDPVRADLNDGLWPALTTLSWMWCPCRMNFAVFDVRVRLISESFPLWIRKYFRNSSTRVRNTWTSASSAFISYRNYRCSQVLTLKRNSEKNNRSVSVPMHKLGFSKNSLSKCFKTTL